jgi:hypothetical protein
VRVVAREQSPPSVRYADRTGRVALAAPGLYEPVVFVQLDDRPDGVHTAFSQRDLVEVGRTVRG